MNVIRTGGGEGGGPFFFYCLFGLVPRPVAAQVTSELLTPPVSAKVSVELPLQDPTACQVIITVIDAQGGPRQGAFYVLLF